MSGRPICSRNNHPTEHINQCVDHLIHKYVGTLISYIRDTQHFIQKVKELGKILKGSIHVTLDVCSLYASIPNKQVIDAIFDFEHVRKYPDAKIS